MNKIHPQKRKDLGYHDFSLKIVNFRFQRSSSSWETRTVNGTEERKCSCGTWVPEVKGNKSRWYGFHNHRDKNGCEQWALSYQEHYELFLIDTHKFFTRCEFFELIMQIFLFIWTNFKYFFNKYHAQIIEIFHFYSPNHIQTYIKARTVSQQSFL